MIVPELSLAWVIAYWAVLSVAVAVCVWALVVIVIDVRELRHADLDAPRDLLVARPRVAAPARRPPLVSAVRPLRPRNAGRRRGVT
jgi:hypothetical protein